MNTQEELTILSNAGEAKTGNEVLVENFRHLMLTLSSSDSAVFTIKFQISNSDQAPDFSAAQSATNRWDYVQVRELQNNSAKDGDTGVAFTADDVKIFEVNTNGQRWFNATITDYTSGAVNLHAKPFMK